MSQTPQEMAEEIIISTIQNGYLSKTAGGTVETMENRMTLTKMNLRGQED
ncbi:hypothetical protein [Paenibacillus sp. S150]|nr:hypothetical protein [Paenibacillus sp. S150]MBW4085483.1 hypothetical protein [Paenibacillus sp. S150]